jgi:DNA (cytosine-5)-methyltransferase 1
MIRAVDYFAGAGGFSTGAAIAGVKVVAAANHWPRAVESHTRNHPEVRHICQDLNLFDPGELPAFDLLLASPSCLPGEQAVVLVDGREVRADELKIGDQVLTHEGRGRPVVNAWSKLYTGKMFEISVWGDTKKVTRMTADHLVWVRRRGGKFFKFGAPFFVRADELRVGDYVAYPRGKSGVPGAAGRFVDALAPERVQYETLPGGTRKVHASSVPGAKIFLDGESADLWWLIGAYLGDGQARIDRPCVGWSVGGGEGFRRRVQETLEELGLSWWEAGEPNNITVFTSSKHLYALCTAFGRLQEERGLPVEVFEFDDAYLLALLEGYLTADGHLKKNRTNETWTASSITLKMLQDFQRVCWRLGWSASISVADYARECVIEGRTVQAQDSWELRVLKTPHVQSRTKFQTNLVWRSVRAITTTEVSDLKVYDFEVDEDHTFCLPGVIVHNCQGHSKARGTDKPRHDASRATAWAVIDCAEIRRPKRIIVENVTDFTKWALFDRWRGSLEDLGYAISINVVNAKHFGVPQDRERVIITAAHGERRAPPIRAPMLPERTAAEVIDFSSGNWSPTSKYVPATQVRIADGRRRGWTRFVAPYYGSGSGEIARSLDRPIGTITTLDRWLVVDGDRGRVLTVPEVIDFMSFPRGYYLAGTRRDKIMQLGNAVPPLMAAEVIRQVCEVN